MFCLLFPQSINHPLLCRSVLYAESLIVLLLHQQEERLPSGARTAPESDSDSGMGSPAEELLTDTTANNREEQQGDLQSLERMTQPEIGVCNYSNKPTGGGKCLYHWCDVNSYCDLMYQKASELVVHWPRLKHLTFVESFRFSFNFFFYQILMTMRTSRFTESLVVMPLKTATVKKRRLLQRPVSTWQKHRAQMTPVEKSPKRAWGEQLRRTRELDEHPLTGKRANRSRWTPTWRR